MRSCCAVLQKTVILSGIPAPVCRWRCLQSDLPLLSASLLLLCLRTRNKVKMETYQLNVEGHFGLKL